MTAALHLIDAASPQASPTTLALLATRLHPGDTVLLLGGHQLQRAAEAAGLKARGTWSVGRGACDQVPRPTPHAPRITSLPVPGGRAILGLPMVRRHLRGQRFDTVHAWSLGAAALAALLFPRAQRTLTLTIPPRPETHRLLRTLVRRSAGRLRVHTLSQTLRDHLVADLGLPADAVTVTTPVLDPTLFAACDREALRAEWDATPDTRVIVLLGDPPAAGDARKANLAIGLANESVTAALSRQQPIRLVMHPCQHRRASAWQMMLNYGVGDLVAQDPRVAAPWQVLPAADAALVLGESAPGLALRWAVAADLPVVAESVPGVEEALHAHPATLLAEPDQPKRLAHRLHQLLMAAK